MSSSMIIAAICLGCVVTNCVIDALMNWRMILKLRAENKWLSAENRELLKDNRELARLLERNCPAWMPMFVKKMPNGARKLVFGVEGRPDYHEWRDYLTPPESEKGCGNERKEVQSEAEEVTK